VDRRAVKLSEWGSVEWTQTLPAEGALGNYSVTMRLRPFEEKTAKPSTELVRELNVEREVDSEDEVQQPRDTVAGGFLVAAYRRPDFRVDATLTSATPFAGTKLAGHVAARYLFGAAMKGAPVRWTFSRTPAWGAPSSVTRNFPEEGFAFGVSPASWGRTEIKA